MQQISLKQTDNRTNRVENMLLYSLGGTYKQTSTKSKTISLSSVVMYVKSADLEEFYEVYLALLVEVLCYKRVTGSISKEVIEFFQFTYSFQSH
jgi:hypothetical protein